MVGIKYFNPTRQVMSKKKTKKIQRYLTITRIKRAISSRLISTIVTCLVGWLVTGNPYIGLSIGAVDMVIKLGLYYIHETLWEKKMTKDIRKIKKKYSKNERKNK